MGVNIYTVPAAAASRSRRSAEGPVDRPALPGEELRSLLRDVEAVLQPDAEFPVDRDGRLVAEAHSRREPGSVALDEIGPLVAVHPDPVSGPVRQSGHPVAWPEARGGDHGARGGVHRLAGGAYPGRREGGVLRLALQVPHFGLPRRRLAEYGGPGDVGLVVVQRAAGVEQHDVALAEPLRLRAAVGKGR